ncbi:MAG: TlpA disulfide reductase family protein [Rhodocyclaceae bacterium]|nr:TlpA disulfide reductase family protein [Rhodocyclaceae bacterium]
MTDRRRLLIGLGLLAALPALRAQGIGMSPYGAKDAVSPAPTLRLRDIDDRWVDLAQFKGRVVLVNFWATWCPPCRKEFPSLGRVRKLFKPDEFEVLAVNVGEDPDMAFSFAGNTPFPILFDRDSKTMAAWKVRGLPTTFLIDRRGHRAFAATGGREFDDPDIVALIRSML